MFAKIKKHKNLISIIVLLIAASAVALFLSSVRMSRSDSARYGFLLWNLMLAWIPLGFAALAYVLANIHKRFLYLFVLISALAWLIFFPNAPYILTDFQHLSYTPTDAIPVWYDVILLIWFAWTGLLLGMVSLYMMQELITRMFGKPLSWLFVLMVTIMGSFGVYVGRFMRWNSWDVWHRPMSLFMDIFNELRHPLANKETYAFTIIFSMLFLFIYVTVTLVGHMAAERQKAQ